eukprot:g78110.t1
MFAKRNLICAVSLQQANAIVHAFPVLLEIMVGPRLLMALQCLQLHVLPSESLQGPLGLLFGLALRVGALRTSITADWGYYHNTEQIYAMLDHWTKTNAHSFQVEELFNTRMRMVNVTARSEKEGWLGHRKTQALRFLSLFDTQFNGNDPYTAFQETERLAPAQVEYILQNVDLEVLPIASIWSRQQAEQGKTCLRKNENGVDINRNWDYLWHKQDKGRPNSESYPGPGPFSEPQSRNIRDFADRFRPDIYVTHTQASASYTS